MSSAPPPREDVTPCLDFPVAELAGRVRRAVQVMSLWFMEMTRAVMSL